jgi:hypothetical protein
MSTPEALYRNAIDLNRYSNSVARRVINAYNDIIIDAVNQLRGIDDLAAPVKAAQAACNPCAAQGLASAHGQVMPPN